MAKSSSERKAAQRARNASAGLRRVDLCLDATEVEMLAHSCAARRPGRKPYELAEYLSILIRNDAAQLVEQLQQLQSKKCRRCGESLPVESCALRGEADCWVTNGWHDVKLEIKTAKPVTN